MLPTISKSVLFPFFADELFRKEQLTNACQFENTVGAPAVNIIENKDGFKLEVAAPGLAKEDFKIDIELNKLTISSQKEQSSETTEDRYVRKEFSSFSFRRSFTLPVTVDQDKIEAAHKDGILTVLIPKKEEAKLKESRSVSIN